MNNQEVTDKVVEELIKITVYTTNKTITVIRTKEEAVKLRTKIQSQMNNGHTVVIGANMVNPKYIEIINFEEINGEDYE